MTWAMLAVAGCAQSPSFVSSPLPSTPVTAQSLPLQPGDIIELSFFATARRADSVYRIAAGDALRVDVADHADLGRERALVVPDGTISLPAAGQLLAAGRTVNELADDLTKRYRAALIRNPRVTVSVVDGDTLLRSLVTRSSEVTREANLYEISSNGVVSLPIVGAVDARRTLPELRSAVRQAYDEVFGGRLEAVVNLRQSKPRFVHVIGEVARPGNVDFQSQINVMTAVASAGGLISTAQPDSVVLVRYHGDGSHSQWRLDLGRALNRGEHDSAGIAILPGDVIYVPKSGIALANDAVDQFVRRMIPVNVGIGINVQR